MKKIIFLVMALLSVVSAKLYSSNQELVFEEPPVVQDSVGPPGGEIGCVYKDGDGDCSVGNYNGCGAIYENGKCNSDPPGAPGR
ncbi:hypothetical protein [Phocaeicola sp.]